MCIARPRPQRAGGERSIIFLAIPSLTCSAQQRWSLRWVMRGTAMATHLLTNYLIVRICIITIRT